MLINLWCEVVCCCYVKFCTWQMTRANALAVASHWRCSWLGCCWAALISPDSRNSFENLLVRTVTLTIALKGITTILTRLLELTDMWVQHAWCFASLLSMNWLRVTPSSWSNMNGN